MSDTRIIPAGAQQLLARFLDNDQRLDPGEQQALQQAGVSPEVTSALADGHLDAREQNVFVKRGAKAGDWRVLEGLAAPATSAGVGARRPALSIEVVRDSRAGAELPPGLAALGFGLERNDTGEYLLLPIAELPVYSSNRGAGETEQRGQITGISYEQRGAQLKVTIETSLGERGEYLLDRGSGRASFRNFFNGVQDDAREGTLVGKYELALGIRQRLDLRRDDAPLPRQAELDDSGAQPVVVLRAQTGEPQTLPLSLPDGIDASIVGGRHLLLVARDGLPIKMDGVLSGRLSGRSIMFDLRPLLEGKPRPQMFSFELYYDASSGSERGGGTLSSGFTARSLQAAVDQVLLGRRLGEIEAGGKSSDGYELFRSSTGQSSLLLRPGVNGTLDVKIGSAWRGVETVMGANDTVFIGEQVGDTRVSHTIRLDLANKTYTVATRSLAVPPKQPE